MTTKGSRLKTSSGSGYWYVSTTDTTSFLGAEGEVGARSRQPPALRSFPRPRPSPVDEQVHFLVLFPTQGLTAHEAVLVPGHAAEIRPGPVLRQGNKAGYPGRGCSGRWALPATPVDLLQEGGHGAQVRVSHLLHQRDVIASQDLGEGPAGAGLRAADSPAAPSCDPIPGPRPHLRDDAAAGWV